MLNLVEFISVLLISGAAVLISSFIAYEIMYFAWVRIDKIKVSARLKLYMLVIAVFLIHTICVWLYGFIYYLMYRFNLGTITTIETKQEINSIIEYIYFSAATYSSLGYDDIVAKKEIKFLTGVEVLNGLVLIAWTASYTYILMEKFWNNKKDSI